MRVRKGDGQGERAKKRVSEEGELHQFFAFHPSSFLPPSTLTPSPFLHPSSPSPLIPSASPSFFHPLPLHPHSSLLPPSPSLPLLPWAQPPLYPRLTPSSCHLRDLPLHTLFTLFRASSLTLLRPCAPACPCAPASLRPCTAPLCLCTLALLPPLLHACAFAPLRPCACAVGYYRH